MRRVIAKTVIFTGIFMFVIYCLAYSKESAEYDIAQEFKDAAACYASGDYAKAARTYDALILAGVTNDAVYYNAGCAYLQSGDIGMAVLNFERARINAPRDTDLIANSMIASSRVKQGVQPRRRYWVVELMDKMVDYLSIKEIIFVAFLIFYAIMFLVVIVMFIKMVRNIAFGLLFVLTIVFFGITPSLYSKVRDYERGAIVLTSIVDARYEPANSGEAHFPLYQGMKVRILRSSRDWFKVERSDGKVGWVKKRDVATIIPESSIEQLL